jgi:excisionase family DNA binding protein
MVPVTQDHQTAADWRARSTVTVEEAGTILGIGRATAYAAAGTGDLPVLRIGRRLLVPTAALRRMLGELGYNDDDPATNGAAGKTSDDGAHNTV